MCLSIPSKVIEIDDENNAVVDTLGARRKVSLELVGESVAIGDYVLIHVGFAMGKIDEKEAIESIAIFEEIARQMESGEIGELEGDLGLNARLHQ
ncbi:MAG: HypC/HybG/HupF family hydrogenase formation chaperone [Helicobacteraceae bacterium]|jgi:hydrogenase expression/formation protein HypC|nr:HypC/HybG/HupF family hydrogenase formation chaperone [Helicobacteraceae bacterium]